MFIAKKLTSILWWWKTSCNFLNGQIPRNSTTLTTHLPKKTQPPSFSAGASIGEVGSPPSSPPFHLPQGSSSCAAVSAGGSAATASLSGDSCLGASASTSAASVCCASGSGSSLNLLLSPPADLPPFQQKQAIGWIKTTVFFLMVETVTWCHRLRDCAS